MGDALATRGAVEAVWRIEAPRLVGGLVRIFRDLALAEDLAQEALVAALERWPAQGVPDNPGAWLMTAARHRGLDLIRRRRLAAASPDDPGARDEGGPTVTPHLEAALDE